MSRLERYLPIEPEFVKRDHAAREPAAQPEAAATGRGPHLTLAHYGDLMRQSKRLLILLTLVAALLGGLYAVYKLNFSAVYRASAKVTLQPTNAELEFTRIYVRSSSFNSANVVTRSHIEYLKSHEIAARAYAIMNRDGQPQQGTASPQAVPEWIARAKATKAWVSSTLKWMNSGAPIGAPAEGSPEDVIAEIRDAISLQMIESSYVLQISVDWDDPQVASEIANMLASVYEERSREQIVMATAELTGFLDQQKEEAEVRLEALLAMRNDLRTRSGIVDLEAQRGELLARLFRETERRDADSRERNSIQAILKAFLPENPGSRFDGVSREMTEELNRARMREVDLKQAISERDRIVSELKKSISALSPREAEFEAINSNIDRTRTQLDDIDARLLNVQMNQASGSETLRVIDNARPPIFPEEPKVIQQTVFSGAAGFLLAMLLILARDFTSATLRTTAELSDLEVCRVLGPLDFDRTIAADKRTGRDQLAETEMRPFLSWYGFDTDERVMVLDLSDEDRSVAVARKMLEYYPYSDNILAGLAPLARQPGYMDSSVAVLVTLGRGEATAQSLLEAINHIRRSSAAVSIAVTFVDGAWPQRGL